MNPYIIKLINNKYVVFVKDGEKLIAHSQYSNFETAQAVINSLLEDFETYYQIY